MIHSAALLLGSNTPDCLRLLSEARLAISGFAEILSLSQVVTSPDITGRGAHYSNQTLRCSTTLDIEPFCEQLAAIERCCGRTAASKYTGVMPMDIDLVLWDSRIMSPHDFQAPYFVR